jgi:uncharacterized UPF0160 family protein
MGHKITTMQSSKIPRSFGTHDGTFHADEVTACALLLLFDLIDSDRIVRTRNLDELKHCDYVCDVGGIYDAANKLFDHHQADYQGNLSSAGMILLHLRETGVISAKEHEFFDRALIIGVDAHDNGKELHSSGVCTYSHIVSNYTPLNHETEASVQDQAFLQALDFAEGHLERMWNRYKYVQSCRETVAESMAQGQECLMFDRAIPWLEIFFDMGGANHPAKFIIMPSGHHWKLRGIPPSLEEKMRVRCPLPKEWAGLLESDLKKISGIPGAVFCHKGRFISVWESRDDALKALNYVLSKNALLSNQG